MNNYHILILLTFAVIQHSENNQKHTKFTRVSALPFLNDSSQSVLQCACGSDAWANLQINSSMCTQGNWCDDEKAMERSG